MNKKINFLILSFISLINISSTMNATMTPPSSPTTPTLVRSISGMRLRRAIDSTSAPIIIDLQSVSDYNISHIKGAVNTTLDGLPALISRLKLDKNKSVIVLYCKSPTQNDTGVAAYNLLIGNQFLNVALYKGGLDDWLSVGYPIEGTSTTSMPN